MDSVRQVALLLILKNRTFNEHKSILFKVFLNSAQMVVTATYLNLQFLNILERLLKRVKGKLMNSSYRRLMIIKKTCCKNRKTI